MFLNVPHLRHYHFLKNLERMPVPRTETGHPWSLICPVHQERPLLIPLPLFIYNKTRNPSGKVRTRFVIYISFFIYFALALRVAFVPSFHPILSSVFLALPRQKHRANRPSFSQPLTVIKIKSRTTTLARSFARMREMNMGRRIPFSVCH